MSEATELTTSTEVEKWVKIGEVIITGLVFRRGCYHTFAVFEYVKKNGLRKYKRVYMAGNQFGHPKLSPQP